MIVQGWAVQSWLSVAGIVVDLLGFVLLLREWWLAFFHENAALELSQRQAFEQRMRHQQLTHASEYIRGHLDTSHRMQDEMAGRQARDRHLATLAARKRHFVIATVLIVLGSLMQLAGQIPENVFSALISPLTGAG